MARPSTRNRPPGTPDTRTRLMDAAEQAVRARGADGVSFGDLADEIGIRKASIHYHFPAKTDLLAAIMQRYREQVLAGLEDMAVTRDTAAGRLAGFLDFYRDALGDGGRLCLCVAYSIGLNGLDAETRREITLFRQAVRAWLTRQFEHANADGSLTLVTDAAAEAAATLALAEGAQLTARFAEDPALFDQAVALFRVRLAG